MRRLLILGVLPFFWGCNRTPAPNAEFEKQVKALPAYWENCMELRKKIEQHCGIQEKGCLMGDAAQINGAIEILDKSPRFTAQDRQALESFFAIQAPNKTDVGYALGVMNRDCWSSVHKRVWDGLFLSSRSNLEGLDKNRVKELVKERLVSPEGSGPTLMNLVQAMDILLLANRSGFFGTNKIKVAVNESEIENTKSLALEGVKEIGAAMKEIQKEGTPTVWISKKDGLQKLPSESEKFDPIKFAETMKKEVELNKKLRSELKLEGL